ncbi:MAG: transglycosylase SLT domain-containing protein [Luteimonas sp.]
MTSFVIATRRAASLFLLAALLAASLPVSNAVAAPRSDPSAAAVALMTVAEARYRKALVMIANADPQGRVESDAALEDMEDAIDACGRKRGCQVSTLLASYKRLLKLAADSESPFAEAAPGENPDIDPLDADPDHAGVLAVGVPGGAMSAQLQDGTLLDARTHRFDDMVQYNPAVQAAIRRWLTDMRGQLLDSYENYQYLRPQMWPYFERAGLPEALLFGIMAKESNGKVHATSRAGAAGPMQFMYATGTRFGLGVDGTGFDTRYDPRAAAEASAAYLNERMHQLNNSVELALAAYNGGEGRALRVYQGSGGQGFWSAGVYNQFPAETRDYVPMVIAASWLFLHPKQYGLSFPNVDARPVSVQLRKPTSIYELAICLGNQGTRDGYLRMLRNLNPRYQADSWLAAGTSLNTSARMSALYERYCIQGPRAALAQTLVRSDASTAVVQVGAVTQVPGTAPAAPATIAPPAKPRDYQVQRGETLSSIARKFRCTINTLAKDNNIKGPGYAIHPGQRIKIDTCAP